MFHSSISTVMMSVITTNIFLIVLTLCLINRKLLIQAGYKLLAIFVIYAALRFSLPFQFPFTVNLHLPLFISLLITKGHQWLFAVAGQPVSFWTLFLAVWAVGSICGIIKYFISCIKARQYIILYGKELTNREPYQNILDNICKSQRRSNRFRVIELPGLKSPLLFGIFSPKILLPEKANISEQDLSYILRHEAFHHFHHDLLLKCITKLITLIYWWDPFCILLNHQTEIILEMRIDSTLTSKDADITGEYMKCLLQASSHVIDKSPLPKNLTIGLLPKEDTDLKKRFLLLSNNQEHPKVALNILLFVAASFIYLLSYTFVFEAYCTADNFLAPRDFDDYELAIPSSSGSYIIQNEDGTYDFYFNGKYMNTLESLDGEPTDIPIYTKENSPQ